MIIGSWTPLRSEGAKQSEEMLVSFDRSRPARVLILPALFDEANKMRRFTLTVMRALDEAGIDSFLPDFPGCNDSLVPSSEQSLETWREYAHTACEQLTATHFLSIRGGALVAPAHLPGWRYASVDGAKLLRGMIRAQAIAAREAGRNSTTQELLEEGRANGLMLGGWQLSAAIVSGLENEALSTNPAHSEITQGDIGGAGLWLRAEPGEDAEQAIALATVIAESITPS
ncbi:MAG: hypothetical protein AAFR64_11680 [Pseudomonadota bacterium]